MEKWMRDPDPEGVESLVCSIIELAVRDWRNAMKVLKHHPNNQNADKMRTDCEIFFLSDHFYALTGMDGQKVLNRLKEEHKHGR